MGYFLLENNGNYEKFAFSYYYAIQEGEEDSTAKIFSCEEECREFVEKKNISLKTDYLEEVRYVDELSDALEIDFPEFFSYKKVSFVLEKEEIEKLSLYGYSYYEAIHISGGEIVFIEESMNGETYEGFTVGIYGYENTAVSLERLEDEYRYDSIKSISRLDLEPDDFDFEEIERIYMADETGTAVNPDYYLEIVDYEL